MQPELIAGRYRVQRVIGRGGMGAVWLCEDEVLGREVAVKQVGRLPGESLSDTARALREARSSASLGHRNVVAVFDVVEDAGENWLVMEYVPSRTLAEVVRDDGALPPQEVARIGAQIADGLAAAHAAGTVHRDVKPGNVLLGQDGVAKISDFGIARPEGDSQLTQTGLLTGTPAYFAPELARGGDSDEATDVWALGATLYVALEGRQPYPEQRNALALLSAIATEDPRPLSASGPVADTVRRMMDPNPATRWSMADAASALRRAAKHAGTPESETRTWAAAPAGAAVPLGAAATSPAGADAAGPQRSRRQALRERATTLAPVLLAVLLAALAGAGIALTGGDDDPTAQDEPSAPSSSAKQSSAPPRSPSPSPSKRPSPQPSPSESKKSPPPSGGTAQVQFVADYFADMPGNTDAGWQRLSEDMQSVGRSSYEDFWGSIDAVRASDISSLPGQPAVELTLTYTFSDGRVVTERQRVFLERTGSGYLIDDDQVLSSRTVSG
jgi:serine/threonine protein kinase